MQVESKTLTNLLVGTHSRNSIIACQLSCYAYTTNAEHCKCAA